MSELEIYRQEGMKRMGADGACIPSSLFGENLEHTRCCVFQGLSAQLLRNRKFSGMPSRQGIAADWEGSEGGQLFCEMITQEPYTRHMESEYGKMPRQNERYTQAISNCGDTLAGIVQKNIPLCGGKSYRFRVALRRGNESTDCALMRLSSGGRELVRQEFSGLGATWDVRECCFDCTEDCEAELFIGLERRGIVHCGMVSLMPEDHFHGMRRDIIEHLKSLGTSIIRWPGGNFAGEYLWRDGLLSADERSPSQAVMEFETQPFSHGFDYNELGTDDIIALCREIGAEPFITINPVWFSAEESAAWIEYCNGSADTPMGRLRCERGHAEPYRVRLWSLGNEMGFRHMEGTKDAEQYTKLASVHAKALLAVDPSITICGSGPYPNPEWSRDAAYVMREDVPLVSLHRYAVVAPMDYTSREGKIRTFNQIVGEVDAYDRFLQRTREDLPPEVSISFDEWNTWYCWYRQPSTAEGMFAGRFLHWLLKSYRRYGIALACYFEPINEGAICVEARSSHLTSIGQAIGIMARHEGGEPLEAWNDEDGVFATRHGGRLYATVLNCSAETSKTFELPAKNVSAIRVATLYVAPDILPGCCFEKREVALDGESIDIPPASILVLEG